MPEFTIETTYHLPVCRQRRYTAESLEAACHAAIADKDGLVTEKDHDSPNEIYVSAAWEGAGATRGGTPVAVPAQFEEMVQRRARHFEILLGLLKMLVADVAPLALSPEWLAHATFEIARGEAILGRAPDPVAPVHASPVSHTLIRLNEDQVAIAVASILKLDPAFADIASQAVSADDIHEACITVATTIDLTDIVSNAEVQAALAAISAAQRRLRSD